MGMHGYGSGKNYHAMMGCMARSRCYDAGQESLGQTRSVHTVLQPALTTQIGRGSRARGSRDNVPRATSGARWGLCRSSRRGRMFTRSPLPQRLIPWLCVCPPPAVLCCAAATSWRGTQHPSSRQARASQRSESRQLSEHARFLSQQCCTYVFCAPVVA